MVMTDEPGDAAWSTPVSSVRSGCSVAVSPSEYSSYGIGKSVGRNHYYTRGDGNKLISDGLRGGYDCPAADPKAFWMIIGGFVHLAVALFAM
jgi:hypothetical protein